MTALLASAALTFVAGSAFAQSAPAPAAAAPAAAAPPAPPTLSPPMSVSLAANGSPTSFDAGFLGSKVYVTGALTGLALTEDHPVPGAEANLADIDNAQINIQKVDGLVQYFVQVGTYSFASVGVPYAKSGPNTAATFGVVPQAYVKIAPDNTTFTIEGGKLPTLIGAEYAYSYENLNIERGLLWGMEPLFSKGVQVNYSQGPVSGSFAFTDGFDSDHYNTLSGLLTWTIDSTDTLAFAGEGALSKVTTSSAVYNPQYQNEQVYNVMYTHTMGPWTFNPYFQYTSTPTIKGVDTGFNTYGYALLVNYAFDSKSSFAGVSLPVRFEYQNSSNNSFNPKDEYSITFTPTYQYKVWFVRGEVSYTSASSALFGSTLSAKSQTRGLLETGVLF
ncbi:MAG TPA: outer membrane beta-barrel protein [Caulobacteraceae bacterium]|nr:outer membrane beta-barrel protein [Caulobacteraceae bacterium]